MSIPGNLEPGPFSGQQQQVQQHHHSINFSTAIPIKKRRFPVFQPCSPPQEEKPSALDDDLKNKEESNIQDGEAKNPASQVNSDVTGISVVAAVKEVAPAFTTPLGQANVDSLASKPDEAKPRFSLGPLDDLGNKKAILQSEKSSEPEVPDSSVIAQTADIKQEIVTGHQLSSGKMNVELSLGPKEPLVRALDHQQNDAISHKSDKSDSLLSLALHEGKDVLCDKKDGATDSVSNPACSNRSNWDLNTTMDVWEGSTGSEASAHRLVNIGGFYKTDSCDYKSSLTMASVACFRLNKGKHILDGHVSGSSNLSTLHGNGKNDDSLGLRLSIPYPRTSRDCASLSDNLVFSSVDPNVNLKQGQLPVVNVSRTVKSEPVDDSSKHDCSIGSCSSTNNEPLKLSSVKRECANNHSLETILQSSISPEKLDGHRSMKPEVVQEPNQEGCKLNYAAMLSVARVMQHQESCASSSAMALSVSLLPQCSSPARLTTCSELTSGDLSNQSEQSFYSKESQRSDISVELTARPTRQDNNQLRQCRLGISSFVDQDKCELARIDENTVEFCPNDDVAANVEEKINVSSEMLEKESFGSDSESQQNCAVGTICEKEDEEYEDGEVREHVLLSAEGVPIVEVKNTDNLELVKSDLQNLKPSLPVAVQSLSASVFKEKDAVKKNLDETHGDPIKDYVGNCYEPNNEDNLLQKSYEVSEVVADEKRAISVTPDKQLELSGEDAHESPRKEASRDIDGVEIGGEAIAKVVKENCSGEDDLTLSKVEASPDSHDAAKDSNNSGNKRSRIINLSRPVMASPSQTKSISNRFLTTQSGKDRFSNFDGEIQPRGNRDEFYAGRSNKFVKDRVHDYSVRNSRPTFMRGKGRTSGRFGSLRGEWQDADHDFASENSYGPSDYRVIRRKHSSSFSDDIERNGYNISQEGNAMGGNRRKTMNDDFPSLRGGSVRRLSSGDRDGHGPVTRGFHMFHRIPRNMSPRRCSGEAGSDMIQLRNDDKFMQHLSEDMINPVYSHPQDYAELDRDRGNRNFSTTQQRKGYHRIRSKSPGRSRTRSPGAWSSPRRRSPNGAQEHPQHRSPTLYRMGRMRSPDHACFHDEMVARRHGSPSYVARHNNDPRDVDSGREHIHPRSADSNRRSSPGRGFPRSARRADQLDSREMGDDEYLNGPSHSNKFHELRGDGNIDDRRKFIERRGPLRSFQPSYNTDNEGFRFHPNDGPRPYRFCPEADTEFVERSNARERDFDGRVKHQNPDVSRRVRNIEEQQDGNYRPVERVWHDDGFTDARGKRRRF